MEKISGLSFYLGAISSVDVFWAKDSAYVFVNFKLLNNLKADWTRKNNSFDLCLCCVHFFLFYFHLFSSVIIVID